MSQSATQPIPGGSGNGAASVSLNNWTVDTANSAGFIAASGAPKSPPSLAPGVTFPHGLLDFTLVGGTPGSVASIVITYHRG